ncbi:MAG TPA: hypothetical protein VGM31_11670 [Puia sp.]
MRLPLLLCFLVLSIQGWCASVIPSQRAARAITPNHQTIEDEKSQEEIKMQLPKDKMKTALIGWSLITYFAVLIWWAIVAKISLDKILKDVLQSIAQHS